MDSVCMTRVVLIIVVLKGAHPKGAPLLKQKPNIKAQDMVLPQA